MLNCSLLFLILIPLCLTFDWQNGNGCIFADNCDFVGHDIGNEIVGGADCSVACGRHSGCTHFSWTTYNGGTCWFKTGSVSKNDAVPDSATGSVCGIMTSSPSPPSPNPPPAPNPPNPPAPNLIDLGSCNNPPCFRIKNQCPFTTYAYGLGGCCRNFNPIAIPNDGRIHEFTLGCNGHGRIAFGPQDPNINNWYAGKQVYSLVEPGPDNNCGSMNYDSSYIDTGILMPLAVRAKPCNTQIYCAAQYKALNRSNTPSQWVKNYGGQQYILSYARYCTEYNACQDLRATAKKLAQSIGECADPQIDSRPIDQIAGCGGGPWSRSSSCCSAVNFGLVDYILNNNKWSQWDANTDCDNFYQHKYTSAYNHYQKWIESTCQRKYQYGFPYADHCQWSSDIGCSNSRQMDIIVCPLD